MRPQVPHLSAVALFAGFAGLVEIAALRNAQAYDAHYYSPAGELITRIGPPMQPFGYGKMDAIWPHSPGEVTRIPVCWESLEPGQQTDWKAVQAVLSATWSSAAAVVFIGWQRCNPGSNGVHVRVADEGPRSLQLGKALDAVVGGVTLNFKFKDWQADPWCGQSDGNRTECLKAIAVHEFGHVLGLSHEQNRSDTPGECQELPQGPDGNKELTPWDPESVMNYCHKIYKKAGWSLSSGDKASVAAMYGTRF